MKWIKRTETTHIYENRLTHSHTHIAWSARRRRAGEVAASVHYYYCFLGLHSSNLPLPFLCTWDTQTQAGSAHHRTADTCTPSRPHAREHRVASDSDGRNDSTELPLTDRSRKLSENYISGMLACSVPI